MSILWIHFKCSPSCKGISPVASFPCSATRNKIMINLSVFVHIPQDRSLSLVARGTGSAGITSNCTVLSFIEGNQRRQQSQSPSIYYANPALVPAVSSPFPFSFSFLFFLFHFSLHRAHYLNEWDKLFNNYSSSPNGLWVNNPWRRRPNGLLTQRPRGPTSWSKISRIKKF